MSIGRGRSKESDKSSSKMIKKKKEEKEINNKWKWKNGRRGDKKVANCLQTGQLISNEVYISNRRSTVGARYDSGRDTRLGEIVVPKTTYCCFKTRDHVDDDSAQLIDI